MTCLLRKERKVTEDRRVSVRIGKIGVSLRSELREVADDFERVYAALPQEEEDSPDLIHIEVRRAGRTRMGRRLYQVFADGEPVGGPQRHNGVFPFVEWGVNLRVMRRFTAYLQIHAATLSYGGRGVIFAGTSGCGKSTLAATLATRGWQYLCDEFALIDPSQLTLHPFPKAICIKSGAFDVAGKLNLAFARRRDYVKAFKGRVGYVEPANLGQPVGDPCPIRAVVFPRYAAGATTRLLPIGGAASLFNLTACCFNRTHYGQRGQEILARVVEQAQCYQLICGDAHQAAQLLEETLAPAAGKGVAQEQSSGEKKAASYPSRRKMLRIGSRIPYMVPAVLALSSGTVNAAGSNPSTTCSGGADAGEACLVDSDCCSRDCDLGVCQ